jgi:hypothetical protein
VPRKRRDLLKEGLETRVPSFPFSLGPHGRTQDELRRSVMSAGALSGIDIDVVEARGSRVGAEVRTLRTDLVLSERHALCLEIL